MELNYYDLLFFEMRITALYLLKKAKKKHQSILEDRKRIRHIKDELRRRVSIERYLELLRDEKNEAARRFLLLIFIFILYSLFLTQQRDEKAALELRCYLESLRQLENARGFSTGMNSMRKRTIPIISDEATPLVWAATNQ